MKSLKIIREKLISPLLKTQEKDFQTRQMLINMICSVENNITTRQTAFQFRSSNSLRLGLSAISNRLNILNGTKNYLIVKRDFTLLKF